MRGGFPPLAEGQKALSYCCCPGANAPQAFLQSCKAGAEVFFFSAVGIPASPAVPGACGAELGRSSGCRQRSFTKPKSWGHRWRPPHPLPRGSWFLGWQHPPRAAAGRWPKTLLLSARAASLRGEEDEVLFQGYQPLIFGRVSLPLELAQAAGLLKF